MRCIISMVLPGACFAYVNIVIDFDDGNLESPVACSVFVANGTGQAFAEPGGMGAYSLHATYSLGNPSGLAFLRGTFSPDLFRGKGLFFYARGRGVWDIGAAILGASSPAYYRLSLSDDWKPYYIAWEDFFYSPQEPKRPPVDTSLLVAIYFMSQERQGGANGDLWLDSLGYFYSEGPQAWDYDGDGIPDQDDPDADSDRWPDTLEIIAGTDPLDSLDQPTGELGVPAGSYFGLFPAAGLTDEQMIFSDITGLKPALITVFVEQWGDSTHFFHFDRTACDFIARQGAIPVYQWPMMRSGSVPPGWEWAGNYPLEERFSPESVAAGVYDTDIAMFAGEVADWGLPIFINPLIEYNAGLVQYSGLTNFGPDARRIPPGDSMGVLGKTWIGDSLLARCDTVPRDSLRNYYGDPTIPDGPERVANAFARIQNVFAGAGADKVIWTLQVLPALVVDSAWGSWNRPIYYYPAGHYPPWHASSAHHGMISDSGDTVRLTEIFEGAYDTLLAIAPLPILLIEFAVHTDSATGSTDMSFMFSEDFCELLKNAYPWVKGFTYANSDAYDTDYRHIGLQIDSGRAGAFPWEPAAFSSCIGSDPYYHQDPLLLTLGTKEWQSDKKTAFLAKPNPFSDRTTIILPAEAIRVSVYDPLGRLIWSKENPGQEIIWPDKPVDPGVYIVVAKTKSASRVLKTIRLKK